MSAGDRRRPPVRWRELEEPKSEEVAQARELLRAASLETMAAPSAARARVAERLSIARARPARSVVRFAVAGAAVGALIVLAVIQLSPRGEAIEAVAGLQRIAAGEVV